MDSRRTFFKRIAPTAGEAVAAPHVPLKALEEVPVLEASTSQANVAFFGHYSDFKFAIWGGLDITFDPYSKEFISLDEGIKRHLDRQRVV